MPRRAPTICSGRVNESFYNFMPSFRLVVRRRYCSGATFLIGVMSLKNAEIVVESVLLSWRKVPVREKEEESLIY